MLFESAFLISLMAATLLCTLVTGFILIFAIVVMPGIGTLQDREFLHAFQVMDRVIQEKQPLFVAIWIGSAVMLIVAALLGLAALEGMSRLLLIATAIIYLLGAQLPTVLVNIPLNNRLQTLNMAALAHPEQITERNHFEPRWTHWNKIRTIFASLASIILITLLIFI